MYTTKGGSMIQERWQDKSEWGDGPWQDEPDRVEWRYARYIGLMIRNHHGSWCGYVGLPPGHPWHGKGYDDLPDDIDVHGGLTFADKCMDDDRPQRERVCHVPRRGESDDVWWIGFDCGHAWDIMPGMDARLSGLDLPPLRLNDDFAVYRDMAYVQAEVGTLIAQAQAAEVRKGR